MSGECSKRLWVMTVLSDDEAVEPKRPIPDTVRLHLNQCPPCRELATRLTHVSAGLKGLANSTPRQAIERDAGDRALAALKAGAKVTGRVSFAFDDIDDEPLKAAAKDTQGSRLHRPMLIAAAVLLAVTMLTVLRFGPAGKSGKNQPKLAVNQDEPRPDSENPASPEEHIASDFTGETVGPVVTADQPQGAGTTVAHAEVLKSSTPVICRYHSHVEAAFSDDTSCIPAAVVLPDPAERNLGWLKWFDRSRPSVSTSAQPDRR
jgi:hypothetical protein